MILTRDPKRPPTLQKSSKDKDPTLNDPPICVVRNTRKGPQGKGFQKPIFFANQQQWDHFESLKGQSDPMAVALAAQSSSI